MHPTLFGRKKPLARWLVSCLLASLLAAKLVAAQEELPPPRVASKVAILINETRRLGMTTKKPIRTVLNQNETVARVRPVEGDPTGILVTGLTSGLARITLTDSEDKSEHLDVVVDVDVEYLRTLLQRAVPTANVQPVPGANNTVMLTGVVAHSEDIDPILRIAQNVVGGQADRVINLVRVTGVMQVQLDVVVARVSRTELRRMSFDFLNIGGSHIQSSSPGSAMVIPQTGSGITGSLGSFTILNQVGSPNGAPANIFTAIFNDQQAFFGFLQALRNEGLAKLLTEPRVMTLSGRSAFIQDGGTFYLPATGGQIAAAPQPVNFGTQLTFLPIVMGNGKIQMQVFPDISSIGPDRNGFTSLVVQQASTTVEMESGQTLVIGGLVQNVVSGGTVKVPILGDLPFIGAAFSSKNFNEEEVELLIVVTPHLVDPMDCTQAPKILPGQETRTPDDFELFLEGLLEAPRGQRKVCQDHHYVPAYRNGPTADVYPCDGRGGVGKGRCAEPVLLPPVPTLPQRGLAPVGMEPEVRPGEPARLKRGEPMGVELQEPVSSPIPAPESQPRPDALPPLQAIPQPSDVQP